jgi:hypothetical protein
MSSASECRALVLRNDPPPLPEYPGERASAGLAMYVFQTVAVLVLGASFHLLKPHFERLFMRSSTIANMLVGGAVLHANVEPLSMFVATPCWLLALLHLMICPVFGAAVISRICVFYFLHRFALATEKGGLDAIDRDQEHVHISKMKAVLTGTVMVLLHKDLIDDANTQKFVLVMRYLISYRGPLLILLIALVPSTIMTAALFANDPIFYLGCVGCKKQSRTVEGFIVAQGMSIVLAGFYLCWRVRKIPDPWGLLSEVYFGLAWGVIAILGVLLQGFAPALVDVVFDYWMLISVGLWGVVFNSTALQIIIAFAQDGYVVVGGRASATVASEHGTDKHAKPKGPMDQLSLGQILADAELLGEFEKHLVAEYAIESLLFYRDNLNWTADWNDVEPSLALSRARRIIKVFVRHDGVHAVNLSNRVCVLVALARWLTPPPARSCRDLIDRADAGGKLPHDFFAEAQDEVRKLLEVGAVNRFRLTLRGSWKQGAIANIV